MNNNIIIKFDLKVQWIKSYDKIKLDESLNMWEIYQAFIKKLISNVNPFLKGFQKLCKQIVFLVCFSITKSKYQIMILNEKAGT